MTLAPGTTVGRYQILEPLGQGGMATVYKAFQPSLQREVALKVLRPGYAQDVEFKERFEREAIAIAKLRHPNIVQVHDFEIADGQFVLAMEFLDGGTLKDRLARLAADGRGLEANEAVRIIWEIADALSYAHDAGVVHRDVKPSNVMLAKPRDRAVVTDFGIARILGATSHTQTGVGIGTPEYMAPEQGQGAPIDHRADIYSLGAMAYEIFTGRLPYTADTPLAVVLAHIKDPLPLPSKVNPTIGTQLERALLEALAKDPAQRFNSAIAFAEAVRDAVARDAAGGTLPTIVVSGGAAPVGTARAETGIARSRLAPARQALLVGGAAAALLLVGGGALVAVSLGARTEPPPPGTTVARVATGANVVATLQDPSGGKPLTITFGTVTSAGDVAVTTVAIAPVLLAGLTLTVERYYDVTATVRFDRATLCLEHPRVTTRSRLYHYANDAWNDRTTTVAPPRICGEFTSFSPVAIVEPATSAVSPTPAPTAATAAAAPTPTPTPAATATAAPTATPSAATAPPTPAPTQALATAAPPPTPTPTLAPTLPPTPSPAPTPAATPAPTPSPTPTPVPTVTRSVTLEKATYSRAERPAIIFRGFPVGTRVTWEAHTEPDGVRYAEGGQYVTTADPHRIVIDLGDDGELPVEGAHVVHWAVAGVKYDLRITVVP